VFEGGVRDNLLLLFFTFLHVPLFFLRMSDIAETESTALAEHNTAAENQNAAAPASCNECGRTYESRDTHNQLWHVKKTTVHFSDDTKVIVHRDSDSGRFVCPRGNIAEQNSQQFTVSPVICQFCHFTSLQRHGPKCKGIQDEESPQQDPTSPPPHPPPPILHFMEELPTTT
jgi:predicted Zn-ribbon and HTH transcriptional regulator